MFCDQEKRKDMKDNTLGVQHLTHFIFIPYHHEDMHTHLFLGLFEKFLSKETKLLISKSVEMVSIYSDNCIRTSTHRA
jgi:hypothetical protein